MDNLQQKEITLSSENSTKETCAKCGRVWVPSFSVDCYTIDELKICEPCAMPILFKTGTPELLKEDHVVNVCKRGQGAETCAFLSFSQGFACGKNSSIDEALRQRIAEGTMSAKSDNCTGTPAFKIMATQTA